LIENGIIIVNRTTYQVKYKHEILLEQAKEMEKEQIAEAYWNGSDSIEEKTHILKIGEQYYEQTYGGGEE
jgi:hypothetical protein